MNETDPGYDLTTEDEHCPCCHGVREHKAWCTLDGPEEWSEP